mgnify:CR=1 FL=1
MIDDDLSIFADPFWGSVTAGISRVLLENHLQTVLMVSSGNSLDGPVTSGDSSQIGLKDLFGIK